MKLQKFRKIQEIWKVLEVCDHCKYNEVLYTLKFGNFKKNWEFFYPNGFIKDRIFLDYNKNKKHYRKNIELL